jgi:hypothetical protein
MSQKAINVPYASFKSLAQAAGWVTYYRSAESSLVQIWTGTVDYYIESAAQDADHTDWQSTFQSTAVEVAYEGEAFAKIIEAALGTRFGEKRTSDGSLAFEIVFDQVTLKDGYVTTTSLGFTSIHATPYNEQGTNGQRSLVCDSTDDAAAGTGARKVQITYYDEDLAGPYTEIVTLDGTTAVDTVATDIAFVERLDVTEVGSQLGNVGSIWLKAETSGAGANIGSIATGDNETNWVHHYIAADRVMRILSVYAHIEGIDGGDIHVRHSTPTVANTPEKTILPVMRVAPGSQTNMEMPAPFSVTGPARVTMYARPSTTVSTNWLTGMNFMEEAL